MKPQHTEDYKQTAVKYYLEHNGYSIISILR